MSELERKKSISVYKGIQARVGHLSSFVGGAIATQQEITNSMLAFSPIVVLELLLDDKVDSTGRVGREAKTSRSCL